MPPVRRVLDRLTYANTVATLALFIALGGVSYAAIVLPANSVGPRQLRAHAVGRRALGFPLGIAGVTDEKAETLAKTYCNGRIPPGLAIVISCPAMQPSGLRMPGREVQLRLAARTALLLSGVVGLRSSAPAGLDASVTVRFVLDGARVGRAETTVVGGGQHVQAPAQLLLSVARGTHTVTLVADVQYDYSQPGAVTVSPVSLVVTELPGA